MTREEHLQWCKQRAIQEFNYYLKAEGLKQGIHNGCVSMASDLRKHDETKSDSLTSLCIMQAMLIKTKHEFLEFIEGFN